MSSTPSPSKGAAQPTPTTPTAAKTDKDKAEKKKGPTKTQAEQWTHSLTALMNDPEGVTEFREYLQYLEKERGASGSYTRYLDFYQECENYKAEFKRLEDEANEIFETYLSVGAPKEIGAGNTVDIGEKLEGKGLDGVTLFDEPLKKIHKKLDDEWYGDFRGHLKRKLNLP